MEVYSLAPDGPYLQLVQLLSDLDEAQVQLPAKVIGEAAVVVMETQIGRADLAHPQLLLLEAGGGHGVPVLLLRGRQETTFRDEEEGFHPFRSIPSVHREMRNTMRPSGTP